MTNLAEACADNAEALWSPAAESKSQGVSRHAPTAPAMSAAAAAAAPAQLSRKSGTARSAQLGLVLLGAAATLALQWACCSTTTAVPPGGAKRLLEEPVCDGGSPTMPSLSHQPSLLVYAAALLAVVLMRFRWVGLLLVHVMLIAEPHYCTAATSATTQMPQSLHADASHAADCDCSACRPRFENGKPVPVPGSECPGGREAAGSSKPPGGSTPARATESRPSCSSPAAGSTGGSVTSGSAGSGSTSPGGDGGGDGGDKRPDNLKRCRDGNHSNSERGKEKKKPQDGSKAEDAPSAQRQRVGSTDTGTEHAITHGGEVFSKPGVHEEPPSVADDKDAVDDEPQDNPMQLINAPGVPEKETDCGQLCDDLLVKPVAVPAPSQADRNDDAPQGSVEDVDVHELKHMVEPVDCDEVTKIASSEADTSLPSGSESQGECTQRSLDDHPELPVQKLASMISQTPELKTLMDRCIPEEASEPVCGCYRFGFRRTPGSDTSESRVCYHGTGVKNLPSILLWGLNASYNSQGTGHCGRDGHSDASSTYVTPSKAYGLEYSAPTSRVRILIEVVLPPGAVVVKQPGTLQHLRPSLDPLVPFQEWEWRLDGPVSVEDITAVWVVTE